MTTSIATASAFFCDDPFYFTHETASAACPDLLARRPGRRYGGRCLWVQPTSHRHSRVVHRNLPRPARGYRGCSAGQEAPSAVLRPGRLPLFQATDGSEFL